MKREELKECLIHLGCSFYKGYLAEEVDKVMDAMEARIKELETDVIGYKASLERANFKACEKDARLKELESENARLKAANFDLQSHFDLLKEDYEELKGENG